jgi:hypothetical protein
MPYNRNGTRYYVLSASRQRVQGAPAVEDSVVGVVQKQVQPKGDVGLSVQAIIAAAEPCVIVCKGIVQVPFVATSVKGSTCWIHATTDALSVADPGAGNGRKFGRVVEVQGQRGTPTGFMRVDLDSKDSF